MEYFDVNVCETGSTQSYENNDVTDLKSRKSG